jgi:MYXO-CTERM domain-containing protein
MRSTLPTLPSVLAVVAVVVSVVGTSSSARARPDEPGSDLFTFDVGDDVLAYDTEHFRVHYAEAGAHRVPGSDGDAATVPPHVVRLGDIYESALGAYVALGFRAPLSDEGTARDGGDGRFDVYLVDFARSADGAYRAEVCDGDRCSGYMVQENDFAGYGYPSVDVGNRTVASHELFHAVQAAYDANQGAVLSEGTAVWASERFDPSLFDLEGFSSGYLDDATRSLDANPTGPVDPFSYGAGVFFQFLDERFGPALLLRLWESVEDGADGVADPDWFDTLEGVLRAEGGPGYADAFAEFCAWTLFTGRRADASQGFAHGDDFALRDAEPLTLPAAQDRFLVFTSASRLVVAGADGRSRVALRLAGEGTAVDGVRAFLLPVRGDRVAGPLVAIDDVVAGGHVAIEDGTTDAVLALIVNTRTDGQGARPRLCLGDDDEVAACVVDASEGEGEAGQGGDDGDDVDNDDAAAGGCQAVADAPAGMVGLALLALRRRRRQL